METNYFCLLPLPPNKKNNSFGHMPGNSSYAYTHMGKDGSLLLELSWAAGSGEDHVRTDTCSTGWHSSIANHKPKHSDDGIKGPSATTLASPDFLGGFFVVFFSNKSYFLPFSSQGLHFSCHHTKSPCPGSCTALSWQTPKPPTPCPLSEPEATHNSSATHCHNCF